MFKNIFIVNAVVGLLAIPLVAGEVNAQEQDRNQQRGVDRNDRDSARLSRVQRSGYLGKVSEDVILSGNLDNLRSSTSMDDFYDDIESLKERVQYWHIIAMDSVALDHTPDPSDETYSPSQGGPTRTSRALAMVQLAVFDALNSIDGGYQPYLTELDGYEDASVHTAVAYAAYGTLSFLYPQQQARLESLLDDEVNRIESFTDQSSRLLGQSLGELVSVAMLEARAQDGSNHNEPNFGEGGVIADGDETFFNTPVNGGTTLTGEWTPDPNTPDFAGDYNLSLGAYWGGVEPFFLSSGDQFRSQAPPSMNSEEYAQAYQEVASLGGSTENVFTISTSTDETRFIANYWGYDGVPLIGVPPRVYNQIAVQIASSKIDDGVELSRVLALVNVGMADAAIAAWDSKYYYNLWRPVTGIRADDGSDLTTTDSSWDPMGVSVINTEEAIRATPPFPSYPSGHATFGAVTFEILRSLFEDNRSFTFISDEYNGEGVDPFFPNIPRAFVPVRFRSLTEAQVQNGVSRVYNGVHWKFDDTAGQEMGESIGQFLLNDAQVLGPNNSQNDDDGDRDRQRDRDRNRDNGRRG